MSQAHNAGRIDDEISTELIGVSVQSMESIPERNMAQVVPDDPGRPGSEDRPLQSVGSINAPFRVEKEWEG